MSATIRKTLMASAITALLVAGNAGATVLVTDGLDGLWDEPGNTSRGLAVDALPSGDGSGVLVGALYTYQNDGTDSWLLFNAPIALGDDASAAVPVLRFNGGEFGGAGQAATNESVGTAVVTLNSCSSMTVEFSMTDAAYEDVTLELEPTQQQLGFAGNSACQDVAVAASCPAGTTARGEDCVLPNSITGSAFLPFGKKYIVEGRVTVEDGAVLTIAPGVTVEGSDNIDEPNFVFVRAGGRLYAEGTRDLPITMTGPEPVPGSWAGVVMAGYSNCNESTEELGCQFEADTNGDVFFGGNDVNDSSGALRFVRILWAGQRINPDEELNSLTLLGVGAGTVLENVQVDGGLDDGFEMFGGTVNGRYLVCSNMGDDCFDFDDGYQGKIQFALGWQGENIDAGGDSNGIESDNDSDNNDILPRTAPTIANITLVGSDVGRNGARIRRGSGGIYHNSLITGFAEECLNLDDTGTFGLASADGEGEELGFLYSHVGECGAGGFDDAEGDAYAVSDFFENGTGNTTGNPQLISGSYLPSAGSPALDGGQSPADPFFRPASYKGAFAGPGDNWAAGWTRNLPIN